jgi:hypothetical protein
MASVNDVKAALAAKVARDGQWDRDAKHHLIPGVGQAAAVEAVKARAAQAADDLGPSSRESGLLVLPAFARSQPC